jgi:hypothetical protein
MVAWGGSAEVSEDDFVYEPLPQLDRDELRRLRATIGLPANEPRPKRRARLLADRVPAAGAVAEPVIDLRDADAPRNLTELLEDVDRKLEKLIVGGSMSEADDFSAALVSMDAEIGDMRDQLTDLQASLEQLTRQLLG